MIYLVRLWLLMDLYSLVAIILLRMLEVNSISKEKSRSYNRECAYEFKGYLIFESTAHEYWYKAPCYGDPTNCFLHMQNNNKKKTT